jgi:drug/metabolite transporter superfamily protein YnfA
MPQWSLSVFAWLAFFAAAVLEVSGDAAIRKGLRGSNWILILGGGVLLAVYGLVVNTVKWDFSKLIGVYVGAFVLVSVLVGRLAFNEQVPLTTWVGVGFILLGGLVIQLGTN